MLDPFDHAARVTGREQLGPFGCWTTSGVAASLSDVVGPHIYAFGAIPAPMIAVTLYGVRRHVLIEDGRVRRDGPVLPGRFRISQPDRDITVEAIPGIRPGKLLLLYLAPDLLSHIAMETDRPGPIELLDRVWDTEDTFLHIMARRLVDCLHKDRAVDRLVADQVSIALALHLLDRHAAAPSPPSAPGALLPRTLARVVDFVRTRAGLGCALPDLAAIAGLGPSQFLRRFRATTGVTPYRFVLDERLARARAMLLGGNSSIAEVALACGFSSQSHLGTAFRAAHGLTPRQYRATARHADLVRPARRGADFLKDDRLVPRQHRA